MRTTTITLSLVFDNSYSSDRLLPNLTSCLNSCFYSTVCHTWLSAILGKSNFHLCPFAHGSIHLAHLLLNLSWQKLSVLQGYSQKPSVILVNVCYRFRTLLVLISVSSYHLPFILQLVVSLFPHWSLLIFIFYIIFYICAR